MKKLKRTRFQRIKKPQRMVPVIDPNTGERRMMDINKFKMPTKIIHETLDDSLLARIKKVYSVLSAVDMRNSREFEHQFKLEHHPTRELITYEIIVNTFLAFTKGRFLFPNQKRTIYAAIIKISYGYDPDDILEDLPLLTDKVLYDLYVLWGQEFKAYFNIHDN